MRVIVGDDLLVIVSGDPGSPLTQPPSSDGVPVLISTTPSVAAAPTAGKGIALDSAGRLPASVPVSAISVLTTDPASPVVGQIWYRSDTSQLSIRHDTGTTKRVLLA